MKLVHYNSLIPFLVGVTSFGKACGLSVAGVYIKVSKFSNWIIETLQRYGKSVTLFDFHPMVCAERHLGLREKAKINFPTIKTLSQYNIAFGWPYGIGPGRLNCSGTLIEPNVVLTTAECVLHKG